MTASEFAHPLSSSFEAELKTIRGSRVIFNGGPPFVRGSEARSARRAYGLTKGVQLVK